jgi:hypothetical protein
VISQILTLYITPVIYIYFEQLFGRRVRRRSELPIESPPIREAAE